MTPLTLNLLAEEQQAERASARDPLKMAIIAAAVIMCLTAGFGVLVNMWAGQKKTQADQLQKQWDAMATAQKGGTFRTLKLFAEDLVAIHRQRALLAPQVARIKDLVLPTVYLTRMGFKLNTEASASTPSVSMPGEVDGKAARPARAQNVERLSLRLEGMAVGARPELEVDMFLQKLQTDGVLSNQMKEVTLRSIGRAPLAGETDPQKVAAQFVIECLYKEMK